MPLAGRTIAITRPREQSGWLAALLEAEGALAFIFPVIDIAPLEDDAPLRTLAGNLTDYQLAFFVSPNAVSHAFASLPRSGWPSTLAVATVGPSSARALQARGFDDVIAPTNGFDSESVLALPAFSADAVRNKRVLILRGDGGRELIAETLRERGATVDLVGCYRRQKAATDPAPLLALHDAGALDALVFTSSEGARFFADIVGPRAADVLQRTPVFVSHARIAKSVSLLGAQQVSLAAPGDEGIVGALRQHFG
ncbi:MAG: uroporphyrinogen-III synthase [Rhodocyclaceae bacterium]